MKQCIFIGVAVGSQAGMKMHSWMPQRPNGKIDAQAAPGSKTIKQ